MAILTLQNYVNLFSFLLVQYTVKKIILWINNFTSNHYLWIKKYIFLDLQFPPQIYYVRIFFVSSFELIANEIHVVLGISIKSPNRKEETIKKFVIVLPTLLLSNKCKQTQIKIQCCTRMLIFERIKPRPWEY